MRIPRWSLIFVISTVAVVFLQSTRLSAQTLRAPIAFSFSAPQTFDPFQVTFLSGSPITIPLSDLLGTGIEVHSAIPGATPNTLRDIDAITFQFMYDGPVNTTVLTADGFLPWDSTIFNGSGFKGTFFRNVEGNTAPINNNFDPGGVLGQQSFANVFLTDNTNGDFAAFLNANPNAQLIITPGDTSNGIDRGPVGSTNVTPEGSSLLLLFAGGLPLVGALRARRRGIRS